MYRPKKSLGQNFLQDPNVAQKIVRLFDPQPTDSIVEIGPGKGALTALLLDHVPHLTVIEIDNELAPQLKEQFGEKVSVIHNDVLNVSWNTLAKENNKIRVIGNIPYNITTPILFHVVEARNVVSDFVVMMQAEVAQRITGKPRTKDYGILSVFLQYYCTPRNLFSVSKNSFFPVPSVSSTVLQLDFTAPAPQRAKNDHLFRKVVRGTFGLRRKTLRNGLRHLGVPPAEFERLSVNLDQRPEELTVSDFVTLADELEPLAATLLETAVEEPNE
ncbi:MAG: 16S rRNA (adenine(1518)-N(6)/adenine(1519)-N(6))-dimethyltransferase RsmA [Ignavibacteriales bacterium]|nr:16S rRNA (adenine(1518)-N(6)/adenine(1519)-N(6))-dimethyltransferase RsmA [Ignavibacteriales bacterium]